ncbi:MAG: hypothetical protein ILA17_10130 [Ruminococcus sp.]|nr:hypothetical protein [Ruminococcus sp.]
MYEVKIGEGVGDVKLGMHMDDVRRLFDDLKEYKETPYGYPYEVTYDSNDTFQISYDQSGCVDFIICTDVEKLTMDGESFTGNNSLWGLFQWVHKRDPQVEISSDGFCSDALGFGVTLGEEEQLEFCGTQRLFDIIDSIQITVKDFWKNEPKPDDE